MADKPHVTLKHPFNTAAGQKVARLEFRRLTVKDLRAANEQASGNAAIEELVLMSRAAGLVLEDLDAMDIADYKSAQEQFRLLSD
ncbi:phage tail assembly protein [Pseudomonas anguilliseptica]|uniref:Phage tail assembly chaperone protein, E, or 41 or 14 n=1 Tax=Pseudomonas anguilliseptica TaxID=53406 RepID=A0A1H5DB35_PSEAG|nr:phage tail assembly protein [Pseudomonas anguilliseptica]SED76039.1 Phage tail assembly chaperone protein, E, or 41 or 14 [Pseudomonas anguilliseptica]